MFTPIILGLAAVAAAMPHPFADYVTDGKLLVAREDGKTETVGLDDYLESLKAANISLVAPKHDEDWLKFKPEPVADELDKRQASCANTQSVIVTKTEKFVDWDVQMSNVACASGNSMDITVTNGYSVSNSVQIGGEADAKFVKDRLSGSFGVNYSRTVTTSTLIANKGTVSPGNCGVMITKPLTTRRTGKVMKGCVGSQRQIGTFIADDRGTGSYNGVQWIAGAIGMCNKRQGNPPLSRCHGSGNFR